MKNRKGCQVKRSFLLRAVFAIGQLSVFPAVGQNVSMGPVSQSYSITQIQAVDCIRKTLWRSYQWIDAPFAPLKFSGAHNKYFLSNGLGIDHYLGTVDQPMQSWIPLPISNQNSAIWINWKTAFNEAKTNTNKTTNQFYETKCPFVMAIYKNKSNNGLLGIVHLEQCHGGVLGAQRLYSIGLAYSIDNGTTWKYLGDIITPYAQGDSTKGQAGKTSAWITQFNIHGGSYIVNPTQDSLYLYYLECPSGTTNSGQQGYLAFARAKLSDVLSHAANSASANTIRADWKKYNTKGDVPALSGLGSQIISLPSDNSGNFHNKAIYSSAVKRYFILAGVFTHNRGPALLMYSSKNGIVWDTYWTIDDGYVNLPAGMAYFGNIGGYCFFSALPGDLSAEEDFHNVGKEFYVHYLKTPQSRSGEAASISDGGNLYYRKIIVNTDMSPNPD